MVLMNFAPNVGLSTIFQVPGFVSTLLGSFFFVLLGVAFIMVAFGIFKFIVHADDETERKTGRQMILWGIVGLFLMLSIWGLVTLIKNTVGLQGGGPSVPQLKVN